jgi:hypothetical protein
MSRLPPIPPLNDRVLGPYRAEPDVDTEQRRRGPEERRSWPSRPAHPVPIEAPTADEIALRASLDRHQISDDQARGRLMNMTIT